MNISSMRRGIQTQEGQALIIGALMMLLLAFGVLMSLNIGTAVREKIRAQNVSDSAAYTLAVMEAQTFNMISFSNRVQAAQYNAMMTMQTYATLLIFVESLLGTLYDILATIASALFWVYVYNIGPTLVKIANGFGKLVEGYRKLLYGSVSGDPSGGVVTFIGKAKKFMWKANYAQYFVTLFLGASIWSHIIQLATNTSSLIKRNDSRGDAYNSAEGLGSLITKILVAGFNAYEFVMTFDKIAGGIPPLPAKTLDSEKGLRPLEEITDKREASKLTGFNNPYERPVESKKRQKMMGEIANTTRAEKFNTRRGFTFDTSDVIKTDKLSLFEISMKGQTKIIGRSPIIEQKNKKPSKTGGFKLNVLPKKGDQYGVVEDIRQSADTHSRFPWGDVMASDQSFQLWLGFGLKIGPVDISFTLGEMGAGVYMLSDNMGGEYWRWKMPNEILGIWGDEKTDLQINPEGGDFHFRVPIAIWDFLGSITKTAIETCRNGLNLGITGVGCKISGSSSSNKSGCGPDLSDVTQQCKDKSKLVECSGIPEKCCKVEARLKQKFRTHEAICGDKAAQYYFGMSPYLKFNPKEDRNKDFNQPSTWMMVNLPGEYVFKDRNNKVYPWMLNDSKKSTVNLTGAGSQTLELDPLVGSDKKRFSESSPLYIFPPGINVISRARVYYHRPGNWVEHPNFFNPFWRAQLAPIAQKLSFLINSFGTGTAESSDDSSGSVGDLPGGSEIGGFLGDLTGIAHDMLSEFVLRVISH
ncbi:hypothetical protein JXR93_13510 [bacterium]|nr:hypothetical protein [bacterium]